MLIIGAKGFAKEVLEIFHQQGKTENIAFYDDVNDDIGNFLYNTFPILKNEKQVKEFFSKNDTQFTIGIGNPQLRYQLYQKFKNLGGEFTSSISPLATIGNFGNKIEAGCNIMTNTIITNDVEIKKGTLINLSCTIGHDTIIEDFVEICPDVNVSGNCLINKFTFIGTNATILPNVKIGTNVIIGAGSVVTKNVPDNEIWIGSPARFLKKNKPLKL